MPEVVLLPVLFLDIDGVLIPFGGSPSLGAHAQSAQLPDPGSRTNPLLARLNPHHGQQLLELPCDLVWATSWDQEANQVVAPRIGLPELPTVAWSEMHEDDPGDRGDRVYWKTRDLVAWAAGRPFVWVDDEITGADRAWVATHHNGPALLHRVTPVVGITGADFDAIGQWLAQQQFTVTG